MVLANILMNERGGKYENGKRKEKKDREIQC